MSQRSASVVDGETPSKFLAYLIIWISLFVAFSSFNKSSFGTVYILLTMMLLVLNFSIKNIADLMPFMIVCGLAILLLLISGKMSERGFNAPINHALKFVYLMFTAALSIGIRGLSNRKKAVVIRAVLCSVTISIVISLYYVIFVDRYAIRYFETRGFTTVIDFSQFYGICVLLCVLMFSIFSYYRKYPVVTYLFLCGLLILCVGLSLYATGVLLCAFGIALGFAFHKYRQNKKRTVVWALIAACLLSIVFLFRVEVSDLVYDMTESLHWVLRDRLRSVADMIFRTDHNLPYSHDRREELAEYSINTFRENPIFGVGYQGYGYGVIGSHQEWHDLLGVFGLTGMAVFLILIFKLSRQVIRTLDNKTDLYSFYIALILFILLGFLNPCLNLPVLSAVFVIAPNMSRIVPWWKKQK